MSSCEDFEAVSYKIKRVNLLNFCDSYDGLALKPAVYNLLQSHRHNIGVSVQNW